MPTIIRAPGARNVNGGGKNASYLIQNAGDAGFPANLNIIRCAPDHGVGGPGHVNRGTWDDWGSCLRCGRKWQEVLIIPSTSNTTSVPVAAEKVMWMDSAGFERGHTHHLPVLAKNGVRRDAVAENRVGQMKGAWQR
ncbi:MAG: hypothetical protein WBP56_19840 [Polyangia bacterium]